MKHHTRRQFLQSAGVGAAAVAGSGVAFGQTRTLNTGRPKTSRRPAATTKATPPIKRHFELGMASYTLRSFKLDDTIAMTNRVGLKNIALKSMHLPMNSSVGEIKTVAKKVNAAGLNLYGCGVVYMKNEAQVNEAFAYAKAAGMTTIIGVPNHELLPLVEERVKEYDIKVAIHNHGPGDKVYPSPKSIYEKVKDFDERIGICMDVGHTVRIGEDPVKDATRYARRLHDVHIKDVTAAKASGSTVQIGRGIIDIHGFLGALYKQKYSGYVSFEYEKDGKDPLAGLAESVGYVRGVMMAIEKRWKITVDPKK